MQSSRTALDPTDPGFEELARIMVLHSSDGMVIQDMAGRIEWVNDAYTVLTGYALGEIRGRNPLEFILPPEDTPSAARIAAYSIRSDAGVATSTIKRNRRKNGEIFWAAITAAITPPDTPGGQRGILICRDVSEVVEARLSLQEERDKLANQAERDPLTGLSNRLRLTRIFEQLWRHPQRDTRIGLLQIDLDRFKMVNDTHGHDVGDKVLLFVADTMSRLVANDDIAVRLGGDEFIIVRTCGAEAGPMVQLAESLTEEISHPSDYGGPRVSLGASIGVALGKPAVLTADMLMRHVDFALYEAKKSGRGGVALFDASLAAQFDHSHQRREELRQALDKGEFTVALQPVVNVASDVVTGFEALIRWQHPTEGLLGPAAFLDIARDLDLIQHLDFTALDCALKAQPQLQAAAGRPIRIGINADGATLTRPDFVDRIKWALDSSNLPPESLAVEVLETTVLDDPHNCAAQTIRTLHNWGVVVALDDFGVGYASLAHLAKLSIGTVKIDRSLITGLETNSSHRVITRAIIDLGRELDLKVIAEGVETTAEAEAILALGGDAMQGYWVARPMTLAAAVEWLEERRDRPATTGLADVG